jgi:uncharacterized RDD family membrane protein YckC
MGSVVIAIGRMADRWVSDRTAQDAVAGASPLGCSREVEMDPAGQPGGQGAEPQGPQQPPMPPPTPPSTGSPPSQMPAWTNNLTSTQPVPGPAGFYYADVPNRAIAYIIDVIIIAVVNVIITAVVGGLFGGIVNVNLNSPGIVNINYFALTVAGIVGLVVNAGYFVYTWTAMRGTVGMKMLGMQVGNEVDGATLTFNQAIMRWLLLGGIFSVTQLFNPLPLLGILLGLIALLWVIALLVTTAQSPTKQGLHDRYAHTMVVKAARSVG